MNLKFWTWFQSEPEEIYPSMYDEANVEYAPEAEPAPSPVPRPVLSPRAAEVLRQRRTSEQDRINMLKSRK